MLFNNHVKNILMIVFEFRMNTCTQQNVTAN